MNDQWAVTHEGMTESQAKWLSEDLSYDQTRLKDFRPVRIPPPAEIQDTASRADTRERMQVGQRLDRLTRREREVMELVKRWAEGVIKAWPPHDQYHISAQSVLRAIADAEGEQS